MSNERKINTLERELEVKQRIINENEKIVYQQAADLARITAERDTAMKLLARADVAFRCDLTQPEANDYYWRTREDIAAILKKSA